jgi:hypothetical protein
MGHHGRRMAHSESGVVSGFCSLVGVAGGFISLAPTIAGLTLAQKMGSGVFTGLTVTTGVVISILFDHFALMGFKHPSGIGTAHCRRCANDRRPLASREVLGSEAARQYTG